MNQIVFVIVAMALGLAHQTASVIKHIPMSCIDGMNGQNMAVCNDR